MGCMEKKSRRLTIRDVARVAGVSTATISRYLNKSGYVDEETGRRITRAVEETGYTASIAASSLKSQKSRLLMLVVPDICNPFYSQMARRVQQLASERGYIMALLNSDGSPEEETAAVRTAVQMYAGGILLATIDVRPNVVKTIVDSGIPAVGLNAFEESEFDTVHVHKNGGTYLAVRHLLELGHTGIAFAGGLPGTAIAQSRRQGHERALREAGLPVQEEYIFEMGFTQEDGYKAGRYLSTLRPGVTAICCANDLIALGVIAALNDQGIDVPGDFSVTGMDNIPYGRTSSPKLTTVTNDSDAFADAGVNMLFDRINGLYTGAPRSVEIPHDLIVRSSTCRPSVLVSGWEGVPAQTVPAKHQSMHWLHASPSSSGEVTK